MKPSLPVLLSVNGGFVDTAGFLALQGLFTSHVTGHFVTLGAALVLGTSGVLAKLLALPMFCAVVLTTRLLSNALPAGPWPALHTLLNLADDHHDRQYRAAHDRPGRHPAAALARGPREHSCPPSAHVGERPGVCNRLLGSGAVLCLSRRLVLRRAAIDRAHRTLGARAETGLD